MPKEATQAVRTRAPKIDQVLAKAVDVARQSAETLAYPRPIGEHLGFTMDAERLGTHWFASSDPAFATSVVTRLTPEEYIRTFSPNRPYGSAG